MSKVLIVGAGLSGLSTAYALKDSNFEVEILEARPRLGGRIFSKKGINFNLELGATWFGPQHTNLLALVNQLKVPYKIQENGREALYDFRPKGGIERFQIPSQGVSTFKFQNGSFDLINGLYQQVSASIQFNEVVKSIKFDDKISVGTEQKHFEADYIVMSLPVQLIADSIQFEPNLSESLNLLFSETHTWMSDSIKFSVAFDSAFWKNEKFTGTLMSPQQIIQEMYDHSHIKASQNALVGFLNAGYSELSEEDRKTKVLNQLESISMNNMSEVNAYADMNWRNEKFTIHEKAQSLVPHQNNGNPRLREGLFGNRLFFSASETAAQTPGYMDGAVHRGLEVGELLLKKLA